MSKEGPTVYKTPMLTCFSQRQRIQPFNTVLLLLRIARNDFGKFGLQEDPADTYIIIILHLQIKNVMPLTVGGNSSHIKCVVEPSWFSNATTVTIWNVNPQSGPGCHMLNSLHCLLLFWEAQESRQPTNQGEQKTFDKSYQYKFHGWKSCLLKERKR